MLIGLQFLEIHELKTTVIRREIRISEGGLYSRSVLRNSVLKLRRLGYFSDVQMSAYEVDGIPDKINLKFHSRRN